MKKLILLISVILILLLSAGAVCRFIILTPVLFRNSDIADVDANSQIKEQIIETVKSNHSKLVSGDDNSETENYSKGLFVVINSDFMDSLEKTEDGNCAVEVRLNYPDDWIYHFTFQDDNGKYTLVNYEIDP